MRIPDADLLEMLAIAEARESFWAYRQFINQKLIKGWWQREMAMELQSFYSDLMAGLRPKLVIEAPPQHGKSRMVVEFVTWMAGKNPDLKTIYTSFSESLGIRANLTCQRIYDSERFRKIFPDTRINSQNAVTISGQTMRNREKLEYVGRDGFFRNTTVRGSITGESLDVGIIDDPIKGREEAGSKAVRDKTWDWFTDDFFTRFSENAGMLAILTRWHIDDPIGRLREQFGDGVKVVSYPAIAVRDEKHRKIGDPLFPELKSLDFLLERRAAMASVNWEALYQQNPQILGGELIRGEWFGRYRESPIIKYRMIYADTAQKTAERNDYSVLECWGKGDDGKIYLLDMVRGKWEAPELERRAIAFWQKHREAEPSRYGQLRQMRIEDKASGTGLIQGLKLKARIPVAGIQRTKDKYTRLMDVLGYIEAGYVMIPETSAFVSDFVAECEAFTSDNSHMYDDQVDPMMDAINDMLVAKKSYAFTEAML
jgi:predicted phage terminase large subunit-like protein